MTTKTKKSENRPRKPRQLADLSESEQQAWRLASEAAQAAARDRTAARRAWRDMSAASRQAADPEWLVPLTAEADRQKRESRDVRRLEQQWGAKMANYRRPLPRQNFGNMKARAIKVLKERARDKNAVKFTFA